MTQQSLDDSISRVVDNSSAQRLRGACLSYTEVLAQSVSVIAPSTVPAAVLGLVFARAGNASWLSFLLGALGLILVSVNINQFARRSASPGSLYSFIAQGLGPTAGVLGGWAILFGYSLTGMSTLCGFSIIADVLLKQLLGIHVPMLLLFAVGALGACYIAFRDIQMSAKMMLVSEGLSILFVLILGLVIWSSESFAIDAAQVRLEGATPSGTLAAVVLVIFGFSGFESSTALGDEAKNPLKSIPRSILQSVLVAAAFFIITAYVVVFGFARHGLSLAESEAPLNALANEVGWRKLGTVIDIGILLSFFACTLASINSTARILYAMAHDGIISEALGEAHSQHRTPHIAVGVSALVTFSVPALMHVTGVSVFGCQGYFGTLCSFGFIIVYILVSVAAPLYLASIGKLTKRAIAYSVGGVAFMMLPLVGIVGIPGSKLLPTPDTAGVLLIAVFLAYMSFGLGWLLFERYRSRTSSIDAASLLHARAMDRASSNGGAP